MPESSPSGAPRGSPGMATPSRVSGEVVPEQTVRAPIPTAPATETTVRSAYPTPPQEQTVRAFVPSAVPGRELEELEELDVEPVAEGIDPKLIDVGALV